MIIGRKVERSAHPFAENDDTIGIAEKPALRRLREVVQNAAPAPVPLVDILLGEKTAKVEDQASAVDPLRQSTDRSADVASPVKDLNAAATRDGP